MSPESLRDALRSPVRGNPRTIVLVLAVALVLIVSLVGLHRLANPPAPAPTPPTFEEEDAACNDMWRTYFEQWDRAHPGQPVQTIQHAVIDYLAQHGCAWYVGRN